MCETDNSNERKTTLITKKQSSEEEKIELDVDALRKVLRNREWINLPVAIISVAGPFRSGKSFLLNSLHHIMTNIHVEKRSRNDLKEKAIPNVFKSKEGLDPQTKGIEILSKPFIVNSEQTPGAKMAVFLMDTQGLFDHETSNQNKTILGMLSFLLSSRQLFNVKNNIGSIHLEHIYGFVEKAQAIKKENENCEPIQAGSLMFVVRDFEDEDEYGLGIDGGKKIMQKLLDEPKRKPAQDQVMLRDYLNSIYGTIACCLLPHPSKNVRKSSCSLSDLDEDFSTNIIKFFDFLLPGNKISSKAFRGKNVTCGELATFLESYSLYDGFEAGVQSSILADAQALMSNLVNKITNDFLNEAAKLVKACKDKREAIDGLEKLSHYHACKLYSEKPKWIRNTDTWMDELQRILFQVGAAVMACCCADEKYQMALKEFRSYLEQEVNSLENTDSSAKKNFASIDTKPKQQELDKSLRAQIDPKIVDLCCESFNNDINKILAQEKEQVDKFFEELEKNKGINTFFDIGRIVAGGLGVVTGAALTLTVVGGLGGVPLMKKAWQYLKSGIYGENRKGRIVERGELFTLPSYEFNLKKYEKSYIYFYLCFGEIKYPLSVSK